MELDASQLEGGKRAKEAFVRAAWGNYFFSGDMNLVSGNTITLACDALDHFLGNCVERLPEGWYYENGLLIPNRDVALPQEWPSFRIDNTFNRQNFPLEAKENPWWRNAFRGEMQTHHAYVDAVVAVASIVKIPLPNLMGIYTGYVGYDKRELRPWILDRVGGRGRLDNPDALLVGVHRVSIENPRFSDSPSQSSASGAEGGASMQRSNSETR